MARYIDVDMLIEQMKKESNLMFNNYFNGFVKAIKMVNDSPTADVQSVIHGKWKYWSSNRDSGWECSNCKMDSSYKGSYCPNCGAKMGGDINEID